MHKPWPSSSSGLPDFSACFFFAYCTEVASTLCLSVTNQEIFVESFLRLALLSEFCCCSSLDLTCEARRRDQVHHMPNHRYACTSIFKRILVKFVWEMRAFLIRMLRYCVSEQWVCTSTHVLSLLNALCRLGDGPYVANSVKRACVTDSKQSENNHSQWLLTLWCRHVNRRPVKLHENNV